MNKILIIILTIICSCSNNRPEFVVLDRNMESTLNIGAIVRYKKTDKIKRNDIVCFFSPKTNKLCCLRVIGFPGDRIEILKGQVLINNQKYNITTSANLIYTVYSKDSMKFSHLKKYNFKPYSENYGMVCINRAELNEITINRLVDSIYQLGFDSSYIYPEIVKAGSSKYFNHYYFGPISIPKVGDTIFERDKMLIEQFSRFNSSFQIIGEEYFFCIGDSFSDAMDSRVIGLIPKSEILGVVDNVRKNNIKQIQIANDSL